MRLWRTVAIGLLLALVLSNAWWLYAAIDEGVTHKYTDQMLYERGETAKALAAALPALTAGKSRDDIIAALEAASGDKAFEKDGATHVAWVSLVFDEAGALKQARPSFVGEE